MDDSIVKKIEALLAKANNTACTEAEAAAFNAKAHELMLKYNVERSHLNREKEVDRGHMTLTVQLRPWSQYVLGGITKLYYCRYFSRAVGRQHEITIVGEKQNLAVCHAIAIMVLRSIQAAARADGGGRSFMNGAGMEVHRRCAEMYAAAHGALPAGSQASQGMLTGTVSKEDSRALTVLAEREAGGNQDYIQKTLGLNLRIRRTAGAKAYEGNSFNRGVAHGSTVQLKRNLLGNG